MQHVVLDDALAAQAPYDHLHPALQQQFTLPEYRSRTIVHSVARGDGYAELPSFVRTILTEKRYAELTISVGIERLQLYPYHQIHPVVEHTKETPLTYYVRMLSQMLKGEQSYDALPNFTAVDVLNLLGIGRNQFLNLTKEARGKLWWRVSRSTTLIKELLPKEFTTTAAVDPFDEVWLADPSSSASSDAIRKLLDKDEQLLRLYKRIQHRWKTNGQPFVPPSIEGHANGRGGEEGSPVVSSSTRWSLSSPAAAPSVATSPSPTADGVDDPLAPRPYFYACELPKDGVHSLYRKGLVYTVISMDPHECIKIPPLENFVMNRTSDDPQESLFYRVLSNIDEQTSIDLLAQLLSVDVERVCFAAQTFVRLGLARRIAPHNVPGPLVRYTAAYRQWAAMDKSAQHPPPHDGEGSVRENRHGIMASEAAESLPPSSAHGFVPVGEQSSLTAVGNGSFGNGRYQVDADMESWGDAVYDQVLARFQLDRDSGVAAQGVEDRNGAVLDVVTVAPPERHEKRIALLYDASLTGLLMMTNLSSDPMFKQHAVTLFEAGKLTDDALTVFVGKLRDLETNLTAGGRGDPVPGDSPDDTTPTTTGDAHDAHDAFGGEATKYVDSVICLGKVLALLLEPRAPDVQAILGTGVDMRKIESLNELEAKTRYLVLGRKYLSFFCLSPVACAPLLDLEVDNIYGTSVSLYPSAWMLLVLHLKMKKGPPSVLLPFGTRLSALEPAAVLQPKKGCTTQLRVQAIATEAEVTYCNPHTCLMILNTMLSGAPIFAQRVSDLPKIRKSDGFLVDHEAYFTVEVSIPFLAHDDEVPAMVLAQVLRKAQTHRQRAASRMMAKNGAPGASNAGLVPPPPPSGGKSVPPAETPPVGDKTAMPGIKAAEASIVPMTEATSFVRLFREAVTVLGTEHSIGFLTLSLTVVDGLLLELFVASRRRCEASSTASDIFASQSSSLFRSPSYHPAAAKHGPSAPAGDGSTPPQGVESPVRPDSSDRSAAACDWSASAESTSLLLVEAAHVVDLGFGFPLQKRKCCDALLALAATRALGTAAQIARHNTAIKQLSTMVLSWMDYVRDSTARVHSSGTTSASELQPVGRRASSVPAGDATDQAAASSVAPRAPNPHGTTSMSLHDAIRNLALGGAEESGGAPHLGKRGPSTQRHLRGLGSNFNGGCPYPDVAIVFDGVRVRLVDDWDPLTE